MTKSGLAFGLVACAVAMPATAQVTTYNDRAAFTGATGATTVETFTNTSHFPISSGILNSSTTEAGLMAGEILAGVTYSTTPCAGNDFCFNIDAGGGYVGGFLDSLGTDGRILTIDFDVAQSAFGFDTNLLMSAFTLTVFNGANAIFSDAYTAPGVNMSFFGFQSNAANITRVTIDGSGNSFNFALDNFTFNGRAGNGAVPEPSTWALMIAGFGAVGYAMRRRKRVSFAAQAA